MFVFFQIYRNLNVQILNSLVSAWSEATQDGLWVGYVHDLSVGIPQLDGQLVTPDGADELPAPALFLPWHGGRLPFEGNARVRPGSGL